MNENAHIPKQEMEPILVLSSVIFADALFKNMQTHLMELGSESKIYTTKMF